MALGRSMARFESADPRLHNWTVASPNFLPFGANNGHGTTGVMFFPLPKQAPQLVGARAVAAAGAELTHFLGGIWASAATGPFMVGCPWVVLGKYSDATGQFTNVTKAQPLESSTNVIWSTVGQVDDGRTLYVGWFNFGGSCLTVPREITFDPSLQKLLALPVDEIKLLRTASLGNQTTQTVAPGKGLNVKEGGDTSFDLEVEVALPSAGEQVHLGAAIMATEAATGQVVITLNVSTVANGVRVVNMSATCPHAPKGVNTTLSFLLPGAAKSVELRILADRTIVEVFAGSGRGVVSMPVLKPSNVTGAFIFNPSYATSSLTVASAAAWGMGCGWAKYP